MAHNPSIDVETTIVSICACFAIISSLGIIATYYLCPNWRRELKKIKKIMVLMRYVAFSALIIFIFWMRCILFNTIYMILYI